MKDSSVILLVENDKDYIYQVEQAFRKANIRNPLKIARYGHEAILYLRGVGIYEDRRNYPLPSLILLDMTNPDGSSMALLGWIRNNADFIDLPILVLVDASNEYALQRAFDRGANSFVVKRQNLGELVQTIKTLELFNHVNSVPREPVREVDSTVPSR